MISYGQPRAGPHAFYNEFGPCAGVVLRSGDTGSSRSESSFLGVVLGRVHARGDQPPRPALDRDLTGTLGLNHTTAQAHLTREERLTLS